MLAVILSGLPGMLFAQTQPVTLDVKEADVQTVFQQIKEQTGLNFVYNADQLREMPRITLHAKEEPVNSVLSRIFKNTPFEYRFEEGIVIVKKKTKTISTSKRVVGFVTDKKGSPLPGVTVQVIGTSVGTATNEKGWFAITLPMLTGKLKFSFVGYKDQNAEFTSPSWVTKTRTQNSPNHPTPSEFTWKKTSRNSTKPWSWPMEPPPEEKPRGQYLLSKLMR